MEIRKRNVQLDFAKVLAFVWIVLIWHMAGYFPLGHTYRFVVYNDYGQCITRTMLSLFVLLSGVFLSKYTFSSVADALIFYKKRLLRFYVLYIIACITIFYSGHFITSTKQLVYTIFGLSGIISPSAGTMWFMSMLMFFYLLTPLLYAKELNTKIAKSILVLILFVVFHLLGAFDERYLLYFPCYAIGMCYGNQLISSFKTLKPYTMLFLVIWGVLVYLKWEHVSVIFGIIAVLLVSYTVVDSQIDSKLENLLIALSNTLLCGYLFHRQIIYLFNRQLHIPLYYMPIFIIVLSYIIQKVYDVFLYKLHINKSYTLYP